MSAYSKWVADEPAPSSVRLAAGNLNRVYGHWLGQGYLPFSMHQRDVAGLDDLFDIEVEGSPHGCKGGQLLSQRLPFLYLTRPIQKDRLRVIEGKDRVKIAF